MDSPPRPPGPSESHLHRGWTPHPEQGADLVGIVLAERFEIGARIGRGGMASVHVCRDLALHGLAAVKILRGDDADARRRFADEARILANLRSPHMVQVLAVGEMDDRAPYMVLEHLKGESLQARLRQRGPLPWREVVESAIQIALALEALHRVDVIHRDVKPSNIVAVESAAGRPIVKLIDLGIAKVHDWSQVQEGAFTPAPRHQTEEGVVVGTPGFIPPEAADAAADPRFDIYGLGVTIYQLCTGVAPTPGEAVSIRERRPEAGVPAELDALIQAALASDPAARISTAEDLRRRLEAIAAAHAEEDETPLFDGCFELLEVLGAGAKAEVYRAYHRSARCTVALKLLSAASKSSEEERRRFEREAQVLTAVQHPALPGYFHCRSGSPQPYIAMTLAKGRRASDFCLAGSTLSPAEVIAVGRQLADGLVALHQRGILHRDVSPTNVLIDLDRREPRATLIDFGMAEFTDRYYVVVDQRYPTPPEARRSLGSGGLERLEWTAPEARRGEGWTEKSDVFSLGLLLYKLLTGKRPFSQGSREMASPRKLVPGCPGALEVAIEWALEHDPTARCDAAALLDRLEAAALDLEELAEEESLEDVPPAKSTTSIDAAAPDDVGGVGEGLRETEPAKSKTSIGAAAPDDRGGAAGRWGWPRRASMAAGAAMLGTLLWLGGRMSAPSTPEPSPLSTEACVSEPAPSGEPPIAASTAELPARVAPPAGADRLPTLDEALDEAAAELRRCAAITGGVLLVEFTVVDGEDTFRKLEATGAHSEDVARCVAEAGARLRFAPTAAQIFTEEYRP